LRSPSLVCALVVVAVMAAVATVPATAQQRFDLDWSSSTRVASAGGGPRADDAVSTRDLRGRATLTVVRSPLPGAAFAFDFQGPEGGGSGLVLPDGRTIDPNFAFPAPAVPDPPSRGLRRVRSRFRLIGPADRPRAVELEFTEIFLCRDVPGACGGVKRWERSFTASGRLSTVQAPAAR
jgi:hypothetical protein